MSEKTSATRQIHFTSKGGSYTAIWMSDKGDLYQEYQTANGNTIYYPAITSSAPITMHLTVTSARSAGVITPASVKYFANGTELVFDTSGACTTAGLGNVFKRNGDGELVIIGNLGEVYLGSYLLSAIVSVSAAQGADTIHINAPVTIVPYTGADNARVTIAPGDTKNFTIRDKGDSCKLKANTYKGGVEVTAGLTYEWYKYQNGTFAALSVTTRELTVAEADVDTYALYKVIVKESGTELGYDIQGVMDASDPYDIVMDVKLNDGSGGNAVTTNDCTLNDEMPDAAYLEFTCKIVKRGSTGAVTGTQAFTFTIVSGNGAKLWHPATIGTDNNICRVTIKDMKDYGAGIGDYELIAEGTLS